MARASILLIDSDPPRREGVLQALQRRDLEVRGVADVHEARAALSRCPFDVIAVSDRSPVGVLEALRQARVIAVTVVLGAGIDWLTCVELQALGALEVLPMESPTEEIAGRLGRLGMRAA